MYIKLEDFYSMRNHLQSLKIRKLHEGTISFYIFYNEVVYFYSTRSPLTAEKNFSKLKMKSVS